MPGMEGHSRAFYWIGGRCHGCTVLFACVHVWPVTEWKGHGRAFYWVGVRCYGCTVLCAGLAYDWDGRVMVFPFIG